MDETDPDADEEIEGEELDVPEESEALEVPEETEGFLPEESEVSEIPETESESGQTLLTAMPLIPLMSIAVFVCAHVYIC